MLLAGLKCSFIESQKILPHLPARIDTKCKCTFSFLPLQLNNPKSKPNILWTWTCPPPPPGTDVKNKQQEVSESSYIGLFGLKRADDCALPGQRKLIREFLALKIVCLIIWLLSGRTGSSLSAFQGGTVLPLHWSLPWASCRLAYMNWETSSCFIPPFSLICFSDPGAQPWRERLSAPDGPRENPQWFMVRFSGSFYHLCFHSFIPLVTIKLVNVEESPSWYTYIPFQLSKQKSGGNHVCWFKVQVLFE